MTDQLEDIELRVWPEIIESTVDRVKCGFTTVSLYQILCM